MTHSRRPRPNSSSARSPRSRPPGGPRKPPAQRSSASGAKAANQRPRSQPLDGSFYSTPAAGRYRDGAPPTQKHRAKKRTRKEALMLSVENGGVLWQKTCQTLWLAANHMAFGLFWGAIAAGISFWFTFWSPFAGPIDTFCQMLNEAELPLNIVLQPEICVFFAAGVGITYSLMRACDVELKNAHEYSNLVAGFSTILAWLLMQWILAETLAQNLARFTTVLALGFVVSLGIYNLLYIALMLMGT